MQNEKEGIMAIGKHLADLAFTFIDISEVRRLVSNVLKTKEMKELIKYLQETLLKMIFDHSDTKEKSEENDEQNKKE